MIRHYTGKNGEGQGDSSERRLEEEDVDFEERCGSTSRILAYRRDGM